MSHKPKIWIAALLGIFSPPAAMLYAARLRWAGIYLVLALGIGVISLFFSRETLLVLGLQFGFVIFGTVQAIRFAREFPEGQRRPHYSRWYGVFGGAAIVLAFFFLIRAFVVEPFRAPSGSMLPTISPPGHVLVQKWGYGNYAAYGIQLAHVSASSSLNRGDILVFDFPRDRAMKYVKRLIGLPGDTIVYRQRTLVVNGQVATIRQAGVYTAEVQSTFVETLMGREYSVLLGEFDLNENLQKVDFPFRENCTFHSDGLTCRVPNGHYFMLGDNRDNSQDSRFWGFVPADHIIGRIVYVE